MADTSLHSDQAVAGRSPWVLWELAPGPAQPGEPGWWRHPDGTALHGVWGCEVSDDVHLVVVANNGSGLQQWLVPRHRWRFASPLVRVLNCTLSALPWVWEEDGMLCASCPEDTAVSLVCAGLKPACVVETRDPSLAEAWARRALNADRAVYERTTECHGCPEPTYEVAACVRGTFGDHMDLELLLEDYAACGLGEEALTDIGDALFALDATTIARVLARPGRAQPTTPGEWVRHDLMRGHHPATTAGRLLGLDAADLGAEEAGAARLLAAGAADRPLDSLAP